MSLCYSKWFIFGTILTLQLIGSINGIKAFKTWEKQKNHSLQASSWKDDYKFLEVTKNKALKFSFSKGTPDSILKTDAKQTPHIIIEQQQHPVCPYKIDTILKEDFVTELKHEVQTVLESSKSTIWSTVTESSHFPVTLMSVSTKTIYVDPVLVTETKVVPSTHTETKAKLIVKESLLTTTEVQVKTYTATNTITQTEAKPIFVTLEENATQWKTSTSTVTSTMTKWLSKIEEVAQPIYITTKVFMKAPDIELITSTEIQPHVKATTEFVTQVVYTTVCTENTP